MATRVISKPTTIWVQPPKPEPSGFATGADKGSFDPETNTWTPGTSAGVVNQASWAIVPRGRWIQVAGTRLDSLTPSVIASVPSWSDSSLAWNNVMNAWNGFAIDVAGCRFWLVTAGGHADSSNNGIYRFDAYRMSWSVECMPSDRSRWSNQYTNLRSPQSGSFTSCAESEQQRLAKESAGTLGPINDWYWDELYWDRRPTSRHVYSSVVYVPSSNELVMGCRRLWRYSITAGDWTYKRQFPGPVDGAEVYGIHDEKTGEFLFGGAGDGVYASHGFNLNTNTWTNWASPWSRYTGADCRHDRTVTFFSPPLGDFTQYYVGNYWRYDLNTRSVKNSGTVQFAGGLSTNDFRGRYSPLYDGGCAMTYIPGLDRYWILLFAKSGMRWLELDPTTTPWTLQPLTFPTGEPLSADKPGRKLTYLPDLNAIMLFSYGDKPGYLYKF